MALSDSWKAVSGSLLDRNFGIGFVMKRLSVSGPHAVGVSPGHCPQVVGFPVCGDGFTVIGLAFRGLWGSRAGRERPTDQCPGSEAKALIAPAGTSRKTTFTIQH